MKLRPLQGLGLRAIENFSSQFCQNDLQSSVWINHVGEPWVVSAPM